MSINVTVSGNPVSIKRGKMVTADPDHAKNEFQKRRRMRLEQVRQQSKEIAENVRKKVRNEKTKQLSGIEKQGTAKLKEWQSRKLLQLQNQYEECLKDIGRGHSLATVEEEAEELAASLLDGHREIARERGEKATERVQIDKNIKNLKKAIPLQKKKLSRDVENARSSMVSQLNRSKKKRKRQKPDDINVSIDSDLSEVPMLNLSCSDYTDEALDVDGDDTNMSSPCNWGDSRCQANVKSGVRSAAKSSKRSPVRNRSPSKSGDAVSAKKYDKFEYDNRISDRIKQRQFALREREAEKESTTKFISCDSPEKLPSAPCRFENRPDTTTLRKAPSVEVASRVNFDVAEDYCGPCYARDKPIPYKPTVSLKDAKSSEAIINAAEPVQVDKVQYYDHSNRYSKEYVPPVNVERIPDESIQVCPGNNSDVDFMRTVYKRDRDAQVRGQKAHEKAKITRDYQEMMRQLPVLQRQERINSVKSHKPSFHLSEDRVKEQKLQKQNRMENHYNKCFPLPIPAIITIPPIRQEVLDPINVPYKTVDLQDNPPELDVGYWDVTEISDKTRPPPELEAESLETMLHKLRAQKQQILKEVGVLPKNSNLYRLLTELEEIQNSKDLAEDLQVTDSDKKSPKKEKSKSADAAKRSKITKKSRSKETIGKAAAETSTSTNDSPPVKNKSKTKRIVLQNTCTQTTPRTEADSKSDKSTKSDKQSKSKSEKEVVAQKVVPITDSCNCDGDVRKAKGSSSEKLCEIIIKIREDDEPEVTVTPNTIKDVVVRTEVTEEKSHTVPIDSVDKGSDEPKKKNITNSWGDFLGDVNHSSSTSYYSVPDFNKNPHRTKKHASKAPFANILQDKPQQRNVSGFASSTSGSFEKNLDPRLVTYIKKLLSMSHGSIEDLGISTVSDISTPSQSLVNNEINNPLLQLQNVMKFFDLTNEDIAKYLSAGDQSNNTTTFAASTTTSTEESFRNERVKIKIPPLKLPVSDQSSKSCHALGRDTIDETATTEYNSLENKADARELSLPDYSSQNYPSIMSKYSQIAENCHKRITNLTAMIEKVRQEKQEILRTPNSSGSDKENSTAYMNLPSKLVQESKSAASSSGSSTSLEQDELTKNLLEIDFSLVEKLRVMSPGKAKVAQSSSDEGNADEASNEVMLRFKRLIGDRPAKSPKKQSNLAMTPFVPLLVDIPRLPKLPQQTAEDKESYNVNLIKNTKRPPPAKGLLIAKRFNEKIVAVPHELSTIVEGDSVVSMKVMPANSYDNIANKKSLNPIDMEAFASLPIRDQNDSKSSSGKNSSGVPDILTELMQTSKTPSTSPNNSSKKSSCLKSSVSKNSSGKSSDSSTEKSELENMESMLRSMGMGWAVATLRKTQEALARSSSTSSLDISIKHKEVRLSDSSGISEVSLKRFLERQVVGKLSTSKENSEIDLTQFMKELGDVSALYGSRTDSDNKNQRTSTPVQTTKSTDKSRSGHEVKFAVESDISSVRSNSDCNFVSLPDCSKKSNN